MILAPIDQSVYMETATQISYCKLFPLIVQDFLTRNDGIEMMKSSNLPFTSRVVVKPGQAVTTSGSPTNQAGATVSPGNGDGVGQVTPIYNGGVLLPQDEQLKREKKVIEDAGGIATSNVVNRAIGK